MPISIKLSRNATNQRPNYRRLCDGESEKRTVGGITPRKIVEDLLDVEWNDGEKEQSSAIPPIIANDPPRARFFPNSTTAARFAALKSAFLNESFDKQPLNTKK